MKNVLKKLAEARKLIASTNVRKSGRNNFSKYDYFTPEQIFAITLGAENEVGLLSVFNLLDVENQTIATLTIFCAETGENIVFKMKTAVPAIKATNIAQQLGGAVTYSHRYLLTTAYKIAENHLDFDRDKKENEKNIYSQSEMDAIYQIAISELAEAETLEHLTTLYNDYPVLKGNNQWLNVLKNAKKEIKEHEKNKKDGNE